MEREDLWKKFDKDIDLYKFYLELVLKAGIFIFGITGALTSYCFSNSGQPWVKVSLILPLIMNAGFAYLCLRGSSSAKVLDEHHESLSDELGAELRFTLSPLHEVLLLFTVLYALASIGLAALVTGFI